MAWELVIATLVKFATALFERFVQTGMIRLGQDKEVARAAFALLEMTAEGRRLRAKIEALPDDDLSSLWDSLADTKEP